MTADDFLALLANPPQIPVDDPRAVRYTIISKAEWDPKIYGIEASDVGPPCHCGHTREVHALLPHAWDGRCRVEGCECTGAGYLPADQWVAQ